MFCSCMSPIEGQDVTKTRNKNRSYRKDNPPNKQTHCKKVSLANFRRTEATGGKPGPPGVHVKHQSRAKNQSHKKTGSDLAPPSGEPANLPPVPPAGRVLNLLHSDWDYLISNLTVFV